MNVHVVFSTKNRIPFLADEAVRQDLHHQLAKICETVDCVPVRVGGIEDHIHILLRLSPEQQVARVVQEVKKTSSSWLATGVRNFDWQDGYGAFSISPQHVPAVIRYIDNQQEHHSRETFTDEYVRILRQSGIKDRGPAIWE